MPDHGAGSPDRRLFVYGTLAPGQSNHHLLAPLAGRWKSGVIQGRLYPGGLGPTAGYPVVDIDDPAGPVPGWLLLSDELPAHWAALDAFEGAGYRRCPVEVLLDEGGRAFACVYALDRDAL